MVEQIIIVIPKKLQESVVPLVKAHYPNKDIVIVDSVEELEPGTKYIQVMSGEDYTNSRVFQIPKIPEPPEISSYEDYTRDNRLYRKEQQKLALKYQNKHYRK